MRTSIVRGLTVLGTIWIAIVAPAQINPTSTVGSEFFVVFVDKLFVPCNISLSALNSDEYIKYFP